MEEGRARRRSSSPRIRSARDVLANARPTGLEFDSPLAGRLLAATSTIRLSAIKRPLRGRSWRVVRRAAERSSTHPSKFGRRTISGACGGTLPAKLPWGPEGPAIGAEKPGIITCCEGSPGSMLPGIALPGSMLPGSELLGRPFDALAGFWFGSRALVLEPAGSHDVEHPLQPSVAARIRRHERPAWLAVAAVEGQLDREVGLQVQRLAGLELIGLPSNTKRNSSTTPGLPRRALKVLRKSCQPLGPTSTRRCRWSACEPLRPPRS